MGFFLFYIFLLNIMSIFLDYRRGIRELQTDVCGHPYAGMLNICWSEHSSYWITPRFGSSIGPICEAITNPLRRHPYALTRRDMFTYFADFFELCVDVGIILKHWFFFSNR